jgi:hypothetical protein
MSRYVFAVCENVSCRVDGQPVTVKRGETRHADDPVVKAYPDFFSDTPVIVARFPGWQPAADREVEQATAAPGEKRRARRGD